MKKVRMYRGDSFTDRASSIATGGEKCNVCYRSRRMNPAVKAAGLGGVPHRRQRRTAACEAHVELHIRA